MGKNNKFFALLLLVASLCLAACGGSGGGGSSSSESSSSSEGSSTSSESSGSQPFTPAHAGTKADPYSVSDAYGLIEEMKDNEYGTTTVYVTGKITSDASDIYYNTKYQSATFMMSDGAKSIKAYSISGCSVTDGDDNFVGKDYEVVVGGVLIKYLENGNVVPEVGYSNSVKNTTELVSSIPPGGPKETFTITFNSNGGSSVAPIKVKDGSLANKPADPTKKGYDFAGWYKDADLKEPFDWNAPVTGNITLYAKWTQNKADQAFEKLDNLSNLSVNIQSATSLGLADTASAHARPHKKLARAQEDEEEFEPSNTLVMTSTDYEAGDPEVNEDGTVDVSFTKIDTTVKTQEVKGDTTLIASAKDGDTGEVIIKNYSGSTITFESDTKHEYRIIDKDGKVVQDWFKGQANETTTNPIEGTYVNYTYEPVHAGTLEDPYSVTDAFELISELAENGHDNETVYVKGTVTSYSDEIFSSYNEMYNSASYTISDGVHSIRAYAICGYSSNPSDDNYINHGYEVVVAGVFIKYNNNGTIVPEVGYSKEAKNKTQLISSTAPQGGGDTFNPIHEGTLEDPYSVTDAFGLIDIMMAGDYSTETVYVKGTISSPTDQITINDSYHSGTFMMSDGNRSIKAYSINGCSKDPTDEGFIDTGYEVVVAGVFIKYNNNGTIVPEIGYSSSVGNTTALVSKTAPETPSEPVDLSQNTVDSKTNEYTVEARSIDSIVSYPNYEGFKYTLTDEDGNVVVPETTAEGIANISTDDSLIVFDGLIEGKQYTLHYEGLGEETTVEQSTVGGEIDKMYVYNEQFTFVSFVPYGTGSRPKEDEMIYESDGIANYDRRDYYSDEERLSFIFDNYSGFIYLIKNFHIKYIHNNLLLSENDDFVYDFKIDEDNNLVIYALFTSTSINAFNFFKDKNGVNCIETDKLNTYDEETDTYYFVAEPNRDDLTKIQTCGEFKTHDELRAYIDKHLDRIDLQNILSYIGQYSMGDFRDDKNQRYYLTTTGETLYLEYRSDVWKSMVEFYMVLPNGEKRELNIGDKFTGVTHYGWWGELVRVSQGVIYGLRNGDAYNPYLACQGEIWFYDFVNDEIYYTSLPGFQGGTTTFINWNYIDQYDTLLIYVGNDSTLYSWTLGNLDDFTLEPRYMWINNDLSIWVNYFTMTELSDVVLTNCSLSDEFDTLLTHGVHGDISYEVVVEEDEDGSAKVKAYKADEYVAPEIKIVLQPINR